MAGSERELRLLALRMNWLRWPARPVVSLWYLIVFVCQYLACLSREVFLAARAALSRRYCLLALFGLAAAFFYAFAFWFLAHKLAQPILFYSSLLFGLLPLIWSMTEISSRERRKRALEDEYFEGPLYSGFGMKGVRILFKYVVLTLLLCVLQVLCTALLAVPQVGSLLYMVCLVPLVAVSVFLLACIVLLIFAFALFPSHVLYEPVRSARGCIRNLVAETTLLLGIIRKNFFRYFFSLIPALPAALVFILVPALVVAGAFLLSILVSEGFSGITGFVGDASERIIAWGQNAINGAQSSVDALATVFGAISLAHILGVIFAPVLSFLACLYFRLFLSDGVVAAPRASLRRNLREVWRPAELENPETDIPSAARGAPGARISAGGVEPSAADHFRTGNEPASSGGFASSALAASGLPLLGAAGMALASSPSAPAYLPEESPVPDEEDTFSSDKLLFGIEPGQEFEEEEEERLSLDDIDASDLSGEDLLNSVSSSMSFSDEPVEFDGLDSEEEDVRLTLDDVDTSLDDVDILDSVSSSMSFSDETIEFEGLEVDDDDAKLTFDDVEASLDDEDLLDSIASSMPIADEPIELEGLEPDDTGDDDDDDDDDVRLTLDDVDSPLGDENLLDSVASSMPIAGEPIELEGLEPDDTGDDDDEEDDDARLTLDDIDVGLEGDGDLSSGIDAGAGEVEKEVEDLIATLDKDLEMAAQSGAGELPEAAPEDAESAASEPGSEADDGLGGLGDDLGGLGDDLGGLDDGLGGLGDDLASGDGPAEDGDAAPDPFASLNDASLDAEPAASEPGSEADDGISGLGDDLGGLDDGLGGLGDDLASGDGLGGLGDDLGGLGDGLGGLGDGLGGLDDGLGDLGGLGDDLGGLDDGLGDLSGLGDDLGGLGDDLTAGGGLTGAADSVSDGLDDGLGGLGGLGDDLGGLGDGLSGDLSGGGNDLRAAAPVDAVPAPPKPAKKKRVEELPPFNDKGQVGTYAYLLSVKGANQLYFGIKGKPQKSSLKFTVALDFSDGTTGEEAITLNGLDQKGMGYTRIDLSRYARSGKDSITSAAVSLGA